jgi:hypothetical protein
MLVDRARSALAAGGEKTVEMRAGRSVQSASL